MFPLAYSMRQTDGWTLLFQSSLLMQITVSCSFCSNATRQMSGRVACRSSSASPSTLAAHQQVPEASWAAWNSSCHSSQRCKPLTSGHLTLRAFCIEAQALCMSLGTKLHPWHAKRPVSAHHYTKLQHAQAADAVYWEGKENGSLTPGMNTVNLRGNRFIFRMVSQESLKQIARNSGYKSPPTSSFRPATHKIQITSPSNSTDTAAMLFHSQNWSSPHILSWETKQEQLGWGCWCAAPSLSGTSHTTCLPATLAEWEAASQLLACLFSLPKATAGRARNGKPRSISEVSSCLTEVIDPDTSWAVSAGDAEIKG